MATRTLKTIETGIDQLAKESEKCDKSVNLVTKEIQSWFTDAMALLSAKKSKLTSEVTLAGHKRQKTLKSKIDTAELRRAAIQRACDFARQTLEQATTAEWLCIKNHIAESIKYGCSAELGCLQPPKFTDMQFYPAKMEELESWVKRCSVTVKLWKPKGIQKDIPVAVLCSGWNLHYRKPYSHGSLAAELDPGQGTWVLIASQNLTNPGVLSLASVGKREDVFAKTFSVTEAKEHRNTFWYFVDGKAFGFAESKHIQLSSADTVEGADRLSWHLTGSSGWRSGNSSSINKDWYKLIYWA